MRDDPRVEDGDSLVACGVHCSETEVNAEKAERELRSFLILQFLYDNFLTKTLTGVITGVSPGGAGVFVMLDRFLADGMIRLREIGGGGGGDKWTRNASTGRMTSPRTGASLGVGDAVEVTIAEINLSTRQMELKLVRSLRTSTLVTATGDEGEVRGKRNRDFVGGRGAPKGERGHKKGFKQGRRGKRGN